MDAETETGYPAWVTEPKPAWYLLSERRDGWLQARNPTLVVKRTQRLAALGDKSIQSGD